ncbi:hypothetical protein PANDA_008428, partial [Ailuropoda melanoleuca]
CPSTNEWLHKMWYTHAMKYYLAIKRNKVLIYATTWMNPENMPSEINPTQKATYCAIPFIGNVENRQIHRDGEQTHGCQELGGGKWGVN